VVRRENSTVASRLGFLQEMLDIISRLYNNADWVRHVVCFVRAIKAGVMCYEQQLLDETVDKDQACTVLP
jgi:hypothetical protein